MALKTLKIAKNSKLHEKLLARINSRFQLALQGQQTRHEAWRRAEELILAYVPETDADRVRRGDRDTGKPKYTTIMLPYTYSLLMSAHTYWTSVFFARTPVHQFMGRHGEGEMQVQAVEALIAYQVEVGEMMAPYYIWLYDTGKYGHGVLGHYWTVEKIAYGSLVEVEQNGTTGVYQMTQEIEGYRGNKSYNIAPYDFFHDPRVPLGKFQEGEFCFCRKRMGWSAILRRKDAGFFMNIDLLKDHIGSDKGATDGSARLERPDFSKLNLEDVDVMKGDKSSHPAGAVFLEMYIELIPEEWGLGASRAPQKWCITVTEDLGLIVGASPLSYIHGRFPIDILESEVEGYGIYNRGIPDIIQPIQQTMDWLINTHFFNVRASMNNQFIVDPSKLVVKDVVNSEAGFIWRLRPEAYGQDISKMFHQVPVQDMTRGHIADFQQMLGVGEKTLGINDQMMGALSGTNRKTATEVRTSTGFGVNRQKTITEYMSATGMSQHAQKLLQTSQQFYDSSAKMRIVGDLAQFAGEKFMDVSPEDIAGFYNVVPVDGTLPIDRMAQANLWKEIFGGLRMMPPQILQSYDWAKMFGWMATIAGLKNINQMKVQVVPDQVAQDQAQRGNVIPLPGRGPSPVEPGNSASTAAGLNALAPTAPQEGY